MEFQGGLDPKKQTLANNVLKETIVFCEKRQFANNWACFYVENKVVKKLKLEKNVQQKMVS